MSERVGHLQALFCRLGWHRWTLRFKAVRCIDWLRDGDFVNAVKDEFICLDCGGIERRAQGSDPCS